MNFNNVLDEYLRSLALSLLSTMCNRFSRRAIMFSIGEGIILCRSRYESPNASLKMSRASVLFRPIGSSEGATMRSETGISLASSLL